MRVTFDRLLRWYVRRSWVWLLAHVASSTITLLRSWPGPKQELFSIKHLLLFALAEAYFLTGLVSVGFLLTRLIEEVFIPAGREFRNSWKKEHWGWKAVTAIVVVSCVAMAVFAIKAHVRDERIIARCGCAENPDTDGLMFEREHGEFSGLAGGTATVVVVVVIPLLTWISWGEKEWRNHLILPWVVTTAVLATAAVVLYLT